MTQGLTRADYRNNNFGDRAIKELTFVNDTGTVTLFTVTGDVIVRIYGICKTNVASAAAGNIRLGVSALDNAMIADTVGTAIIANEIWHDATPNASIEAMSVIREYIVSNGDDIILTLDAQIDSGKIDFTCWWIPVSADGGVVPA